MSVSSRDVLSRLDPRIPESEIRNIEAAAPPLPAEPQRAASVVLLRDHDGRLQTFALHRHARMPFAPGMVVFPGGRLDPVDGVPHIDHDLADPALLACSVRETEEETGVRLQRSDLRPWAHWITPATEPRRYDTSFYLARLPDRQHARDISGETTSAEWRSPAELLAAADAGELSLMPPTRSILIELTAFDSVDSALAAADRRRVETVLPKAVRGSDGWVFEYGRGDDGPVGSGTEGG